MTTQIIIGLLVGVLVGTGVGIALSYTFLKKAITKNSLNIQKEAEALMKKSVEDAELVKKERILQAKEKFLQLKSEHEKEINSRNSRVLAAENKLKQKEVDRIYPLFDLALIEI